MSLTRYRDKGWMVEDRRGEWVKLADVRALVEKMEFYCSNPAAREGFEECQYRILAALKETP